MPFVPDPEPQAGGRFIPDGEPSAPGLADSLAASAADAGATLKNVGMGALRGAARIGTTLLAPVDYATEKLTGEPVNRRERVDAFFQDRADPESLAFKAGDLGAQVAGTAGVGGALAKGAAAIPGLAQIAPKLATALETGGFRLGPAATTAAGRVGDLATRVGAGAAVGGVSAGLVDPESAGAGAAIGGIAPAAVKAAGAAGSALVPKASDAVVALAKRAEELGIRIPADRIAQSKPLNAAAASLNYVPLSGRAGTEQRMLSQFNRAVSRTFGQDSDNVTMALRRADNVLGSRFDQFLQANRVGVDQQFLDELVDHASRAQSELSAEGAKIIGNQIDAIIDKAGAGGLIDGQAAYNIKKTLDRIGRRNSNEAFYALDLKQSLMDALNRSVGPNQAAEFATLRQQYGNMLTLEKMSRRGAEGGISVAKLAGAPAGRIRNSDLGELADIAAQFLVSRESPHGAAQRVTLGALAAGVAGGNPAALPAIAGTVAAGRAANSALNSQAMRGLAMGEAPRAFYTLDDPMVRGLLYQGGATSARP